MAVGRQFGSRLDDIEGAEVGKREDVPVRRRRFGDLPHLGMRHLASHEGNVLNARDSHIGYEHAVAEQMAGILLAQQARTDPTIGGRVSGHI
jgi:hypothetical protein